MNRKKQGIAIVALSITIAIIAMLATTAVISVQKTLETAKISTYAGELDMIKDTLGEYIQENTLSSCILENIELNVTNIPTATLNTQFEGETITNNKILFYLIDMDKLGIISTKYGNKKDAKDVYVVSKDTLNVYYLNGVKIDGVYYYTLTENLKSNTIDKNITSNSEDNGHILFLPNTYFWTNEAVEVTVMLPEEASLTSITVTDDGLFDVQVGTPYIENGYTKLDINADGLETNYTINVAYTYGEQSMTAKYNVTNFDNVAPEITVGDQVYTVNGEIVVANIIGISAKDNLSGTEILKYDGANLSESDATAYFNVNGENILDTTIPISSGISIYTIYALDAAGNSSIATVNISQDIIDALGA